MVFVGYRKCLTRLVLACVGLGERRTEMIGQGAYGIVSQSNHILLVAAINCLIRLYLLFVAL
jgi:hypothetical protein